MWPVPKSTNGLHSDNPVYFEVIYISKEMREYHVPFPIFSVES